MVCVLPGSEAQCKVNSGHMTLRSIMFVLYIVLSLFFITSYMVTSTLHSGNITSFIPDHFSMWQPNFLHFFYYYYFHLKYTHFVFYFFLILPRGFSLVYITVTQRAGQQSWGTAQGGVDAKQ